jgi:DNA modification methylase
MHPTVKPVALVADALLDCSARGDVVLDSFLGSGSTLLAAERVGRVCCGMEIEPKYVDVAIRRWHNLTGERAIHDATGRAFDELGLKEAPNA